MERFDRELVKRVHREMESYLAVEVDELYAFAAIHALRAVLTPQRPQRRYEVSHSEVEERC